MSTASTTAASHAFADINSSAGSMSFPWALQPAMNPIPEATHIMAPPLASPKQLRTPGFGGSTSNGTSSGPWQFASPSSSPSTSTDSSSLSPPPLSHHTAGIEVVLAGPEGAQHFDEYLEGDEEEEEETLMQGGGSGFEEIAIMPRPALKPAAAAPAPTAIGGSSSLQQQQQQQQQKKIARGKKAQQAAMRAHGEEEDGGDGEGGSSGKERPNLSYARLAAMAIEDDPRKKCTVGEIYLWIEQRFPYYKSGAPWWKNCIRHNLSMKKCFVRVQGQGGNLWGLDPTFRDDILGDSPTPKSLLRKPRRHSTSATGTELGAPVPIAQATPVPRRNSTPASMAAAAAAAAATAAAVATGKAPAAAKRKAAAPKAGTKPMKRSNSGKLERKSSAHEEQEGEGEGEGEREEVEEEEDVFGGRSMSAAASAALPVSGGMFEDPSAMLEDCWLDDMMANIDAVHTSNSASRIDTFSPPFRSFTRLFQNSPSAFAQMPLPISDDASLMHSSNFSDPLFRLTPSAHLDAHIDWDLPSFA